MSISSMDPALPQRLRNPPGRPSTPSAWGLTPSCFCFLFPVGPGGPRTATVQAPWPHPWSTLGTGPFLQLRTSQGGPRSGEMLRGCSPARPQLAAGRLWALASQGFLRVLGEGPAQPGADATCPCDWPVWVLPGLAPSPALFAFPGALGAVPGLGPCSRPSPSLPMARTGAQESGLGGQGVSG